jgi:Protein of unknown function (DUF3037)
VPAPARSSFAYTVLRAVPRVERAEFINAGVLLFCRERRFLEARTGLDGPRLMALAPDCDFDDIAEQLIAIRRVASGEAAAGPIARLPKAERFHWLASPSSTIVQRSEVHTGLTDDPASTLDHLFRTLVMTPGARLPRHGGWSRASRLPSIPELVGRTVTRVRRLHYVYGGETNMMDGPIELTFGDGFVALIDASADWRLEFYGAPWIDPFQQPLSELNRAYVDRYGKWAAMDVSGTAPYGWLVGGTITQAIPQFNDLLELTGLLVRTEDAVLDLQQWAGELRAFVRRG